MKTFEKIKNSRHYTICYTAPTHAPAPKAKEEITHALYSIFSKYCKEDPEK